MRVLFLSAWFPHPPSNGSRLRVNALLRALARQHEVQLLAFADQADVDPTAPAMRELCTSLQVFPRIPFDPSSGRLAWLSLQPRSLATMFSAPMAHAVAHCARTCDVVVASQLACAAYAPWFGEAPALFEEVELGALHGQVAQGPAIARWRTSLMWAKHRRYLRRLLRRFAACTVVSEPERALLATVVDDRRVIHVLPNGVVVPDRDGPSAPRPDTVIFTGSFRYHPNHEAMRWFVAEVWPRVLRQRPTARLVITGDHGDLPLPPAQQVERTGLVDDVRPLLGASWLAVAPIFAGGGTRLKILESMAAGTPVVATSKGAEGIDAIAGEQLLIADDPAGFAAHVVRLLTDAALRARLSSAGRRLVAERHDWRLLGPRFEALVRSIAEHASPRR